MKFNRVEGKLPVGVAVRINERLGVFDRLMEWFSERSSHHTSNAPITFALEVPEGLEEDVAGALRAMADELSKP